MKVKGGLGCKRCCIQRLLLSQRSGQRMRAFTDGRFSGGTSGLSIGHASPEAAEGGAIALGWEGDSIHWHPKSYHQYAGERRRAGSHAEKRWKHGRDAWKPVSRERHVSLRYVPMLLWLPAPTLVRYVTSVRLSAKPKISLMIFWRILIKMIWSLHYAGFFFTQTQHSCHFDNDFLQ